MKAEFYPTVGLLAALALGGCGHGNAPTGPAGTRMGGSGRLGAITIVLSGFRSEKGRARIALFSSADGFPNDRDSAFKLEIAKIRNHEARVALPEIPPGRYAVSVFHDEDDDGRMQTTLLGVPTEGYGISNNPAGRLGPPSFPSAAFNLDSDRVAVRITIRYR